MSLFRYEALDRTGKLVMGTMDAASEAAVDARLSQMGYRTERVMPAQTIPKPASSRTGSQPALPRTVALPQSKLGGAKAKDMALFFRQFAALVRSGISIYQALEHLAPRTIQPALHETAQEMAQAAHSGGRISDVMAKHPRLYPEHVVGTVRAGEKGGFLEIVLDEIAYEYEQEVAFYKGTWLPKTLIVTEAVAVCLAQPLFPTLFPEFKLVTYLAFVFLRNLPIGAAVFFLGWLWWKRLQEPGARYRRDTLALKMPVFGDLARQRSLASFVRMLRRVYQAGVGPINAWEGAMNVAPNAVIRERLNEAYGMMQKNVPMHDAFTATRLFANEAEQLLATGVVSGQVVDMLDRVAAYYQENVDRAFGSAKFWMYRLAITAFIVLMGVVVCWMAYSYFKGIFNFVDTNFSTD